MAWLIETFLNEEMKTAADFTKKQIDANYNKAEYNEKSAERFGRKNSNDLAKAASDKDVEDMQKNAVKSSDEQIKAVDHLMKGDLKGSIKYSKQAVDTQGKTSSIMHKIDAVDRHNRRHPDKKAANECALIIEILQ